MRLWQWWTVVRRLLERHPCVRTQTSRWRHPLVGYVVSVLLVGLGLGIGLIETHYLTALTFPGMLLLFAVVPVALFWGIGPALLTVLLSVFVLDYLYVPPLGVAGNYGWNEAVRLCTFAAAGIVVALLTNQREIARLQAVEAQREATLRTCELEALFNAISDAIVVYDKNGRVVQTNEATGNLFGLQHVQEQERIEVQQRLLYQAACSNAQGKLMPALMQPLTRLLHGEMLPGNGSADVMIQTADGRTALCNLNGSPIRDSAGAIERAVLIYRDVTERRRLEQRTTTALQALLAMAHALVQAPEATHEDAHYGLGNMNYEQVGQKVAELARHVIECAHVVLVGVERRDHGEVVTPIAATGFTAEQERQWRGQFHNPQSLVSYVGGEVLVAFLKDDEVLLLDGTSLPLYTPVLPFNVQTVLVVPVVVEQRLVGLLCLDDGSREHAYTAAEMSLAQTTARLLSLYLARVQLQREYTLMQAHALAARETTRRMEDFLSIICHELKTPLTVMSGNLQLAERKLKRLLGDREPGGRLDTKSKQMLLPLQHLLAQADGQVVLQTRLINDLLDVARAQTGNLRVCMGACDLLPLVQNVVTQQRQITRGRVIHVHFPEASTLSVYADSDRIMQVLTNFLSNALKYSPEEMPVEVWVGVEQEQVRVCVRDRGPGIPVTEQQRIWERFYRAIDARNGAHVGLGVGLYLCRMIIEQHGGDVGVESIPGQGATFWFTLPLLKADEAAGAPEE